MSILITAFRSLLGHLYQAKRWDFEARETSEAGWVVEKILSRYHPIGEDMESFLLPSERQLRLSLADTKQFLYLQPGKMGPTVVPVLGVGYDFTNVTGDEGGEARFRLGLFTKSQDNRKSAGVQSIGMRLETSHGRGAHDFCHFQFIQHFLRSEDTRLKGSPSWLPTKEPTIPIDARNPVSLLMLIILSLYGPDAATGLSFGEKNALKKYIAVMHVNVAGF